ncbi:biotin transporter BioY [Ruminococcaceae bacterium OttesenSCG-928-I18]|nr:biotin transporter BioY [Ruminococcaceae bacterium OttesenSCG-928-I18]
MVPIGPVPFTLAILGVAFLGAMLPPPWAAGSLGAYLLLGLCGLPVFAGFNAGPGVLLGPTGGYLAGYFLLALAVSLARKKPLPLQWLAAAAGMSGCYLLGTLWYTLVTGATFLSGLVLCVVPFVLPDALKITLALLLARALQRRMAKRPT